MSHNLWVGLLCNASWLLSLFVLYEFTSQIKSKHQRLVSILYGVLIGAICVAVMALPFSLRNGIVFDARSILLSITALIFGGIPVTIAAAAAIVFRVWMGGAGLYAGVASIITSAAIGLLWRKWAYPKKQGPRWASIYLMSLAVHVVMLLDLLLLPASDRFAVLGAVIVPVMLLYPLVSILLSMLLIHQQERIEYQETIQKNAEEHRRITDNISDVVWLADMDFGVTYVSPSVERVLGIPPEEYRTRSLGERLPPEALHTMNAIYAEELHTEQDAACAKDRTRIVELEHYKADGSRVWLSTHVSFLRDAAGTPVGIQGVTRDISEKKANELALEAARSKAQRYIDISPILFVALDLDGMVTLINREGCHQLGYPKERILGKHWSRTFVPERDRSKLEATLQTLRSEPGDRIIDLESALLTEQPNERMMFWRMTTLKDPGEQTGGFLLSGIDITEKTNALTDLGESERSKRVLLENLPGMTYRCRYDRQWTMQYVSNGCLDLTGYPPEALLHNRELSFNDLIAPEAQEYLWKKWEEVLRDHAKLKEEYEITTASGERKWVWEQGQGIYAEDGSVIALEGIILDGTERKKYENELKFIADHSPLTGLLNLRAFHALLSSERTREAAARCAIIINIQRFSYLNRIFGYAFCDQLIQDIANCLRSVVSEHHTLFHLSIDRFLIYAAYEDKSALLALIERIMTVLQEGITLNTVCFALGILEMGGEEAMSPEHILKRAEIACEYRNDHSRFTYTFFNRDMEAKQQRELAISNSFQQTLHQETDSSLFMHYQPITRADDNQIVGFEALARYRTEDLGLVSPLEFIPLVEATQMILPLGKRIMRLVFDFALRLERAGFQDTSVSFNLSAIQLLSESFLADLTQLIEQTGVNPQNLMIELTESVFSDNYVEINNRLDELKALGIKIAIDDFGTGYSSLARERELHVDILKIDRYFVRDLTTALPENTITGDIISMAHKMGHMVIAEGVELEEQRQYLVAQHCDWFQGYLFGKPMAEDAALALLMQQNQARG